MNDKLTTNNSPLAIKVVPALRFPEFSGAWDKNKLEALTKVASGGTPNRGNDEFWNGGNIPWITTSLIDFNEIFVTFECITKEGLVNSSAKYFPVDTILIAMYGQGKTRGKVAILKIEAATNQACAALIPNKNLYSAYLFQYFVRSYEFLRKLSNDGGQKNLSAGLIKNINISFPSIEEQQKIASFLTSVDTKIEQLGKKKALLEKYKKGMMQKLFSQTLRFKDALGNDKVNGEAREGSLGCFPDWEEKQLGELASEKFTNGVFNDPMKVGSGYRLINVKDMYTTDFINGEKLKRVAILKSEYEKNRALYGDIFFTRSSLVKEGIAYSNIFLEHSDETTFDGHLIRMRPDDSLVNTVFLFHLLKSDQARRQLVARGKTGTMTTIGQKDISTVVLKIPCLEEQQKIASFLSGLDKKIDLITTELNQAKTFKKGLLQQMFI